MYADACVASISLVDSVITAAKILAMALAFSSSSLVSPRGLLCCSCIRSPLYNPPNDGLFHPNARQKEYIIMLQPNITFYPLKIRHFLMPLCKMTYLTYYFLHAEPSTGRSAPE